jgi:hypothetical protein
VSLRRPSFLVFAFVALTTPLASACGKEAPEVARPAFERQLVEQEDLTVEQAGCVGDYVFDAYEAQEIRVIHEEGMTKLPWLRWGEYAYAMVACVIHDEVVEPLDPAARSASPSRPGGGP